MRPYIQASLWGDEKQAVPTEHFIECTHFDGRIEIVSTLDPTVNWQDTSVHMARFIEKKVSTQHGRKQERVI